MWADTEVNDPLKLTLTIPTPSAWIVMFPSPITVPPEMTDDRICGISKVVGLTIEIIGKSPYGLPALLGNKYDKNKSETENMLLAGYKPIYDCGHKKYLLKIKWYK